MKTFELFAAVIFAVGILLIGGMGVDLTYIRAGGGMVACAIGCLFIAIAAARRDLSEVSGTLVTLVVAGGAYFIWRALSVGPIGLAVEDVTLVLIILGAFFTGVAGREAATRIFVGSIGIACFANAILVAYQMSGESQWFLWRDPFGSKVIASGFFGHYNYLAAFLNGSLFLFLTLALTSKRWLHRSVCGIVAVSAFASLIATGSRGGWVAFVVGFGVWVILGLIQMKGRKHPGFGLAAIVSLVMVIALVVTSFSVVQELSNRRAGINDREEMVQKENVEIGDGGRVYFLQMAFEIFQESPVVGSGPRSFSYLALEHWDLDDHLIWSANPVFAHNEYLQVLADYGMVGFVSVILVLFILFVTGVISILFEGSPEAGSMVPLKIGALSGLAAMLAQSFFSFVFHIPACAVLVGILLAVASRRPARPRSKKTAMTAGLVVCSLLFVAGGLGFLGWRFTQSYRLYEGAKTAFASRTDGSDVFKLLEAFQEAATKGYRYEILENSGRLALDFSTRALDRKHEELAGRYAEVALDHLKKAAELNPHSSVALVMVPYVQDALGEFGEAEAGYAKAMEALRVREPYLKSHLYAAQSQYRRGLAADRNRRNVEALGHYRLAVKRLERRVEIMNSWREIPEDKALRLEIEARIAFLEGERLALEGDRIWKKARPRNPELAYALFLAAAERYQASATIMEPLSSLWRAQRTALLGNLELLKGARTRPALLSEEDISNITDPEAGLDPAPATR